MNRTGARSAAALAAAVIALSAAFIPTPYWIVAPGAAVDLSRTIAVQGHAPPRGRYFLTDVSVSRATGFGLLARFVPGLSLVRQDAVMPAGASAREFDRLEAGAMTASQGVAAFVAERAAGFKVGLPSQPLPVPVRFALGNVRGGSGGLMFALHIHAALCTHCAHRDWAVAGTGMLAPDGSVRPIEGTLQKLIAARRAGARVFLVPRENYAEIAAERGIRIIPVASFGEALSALAG